MQRLSSRLQEPHHEVSLPRRGSDTSILWKTIELHAMSKLRHVQFHVVTKVLRIFLVP